MWSKGKKNNSNIKGTSKANRGKRSILVDEEFYDRVIDWNTFFRRNIHRFVEMYFGFKLHFYQVIMIYLMNLVPFVVIVAARAASKSFLISIYACARCVLYPNTKVVIASSTKRQSSLIVTEKIQKELMPKSANLRREIIDIKAGMNETEVKFRNGSSLIVAAANEGSRGLRANIIIYEEFRLLKREVIDSIISPFLFVRQAEFLKKKEYEHLEEEPIEIYISSAYFSSHWMSKTIKDSVLGMYNKSNAIFFALDYSITLKHKLRTKAQMIKEKKKLGAMQFAMEYENLMVGQSDNPFYTFEQLDVLQNLGKAFYPKELSVIEGKKGKLDIPKVAGEIRVLSCDIALVNKAENDNSAFSCIRALPSGDYYERQVPYLEAYKEDGAEKKAIRIKQLFYDFKADYIVLDTLGAGSPVMEYLGKITYDEVRDIEYPAFTSFNNEDDARLVKNKEAMPIVFSFKGNLEINQKMHFAMNDVIENRRIKLLLNSSKAADYLENQEFYNKITSLEAKVDYENPYIQTDLLINEMVNLKKVWKQDKYLTLEEPSTGTKDRYISVAMGNYFIKTLEDELNEDEEDEEDEYDFSYGVSEIDIKI